MTHRQYWASGFNANHGTASHLRPIRQSAADRQHGMSDAAGTRIDHDLLESAHKIAITVVDPICHQALHSNEACIGWDIGGRRDPGSSYPAQHVRLLESSDFGKVTRSTCFCSAVDGAASSSCRSRNRYSKSLAQSVRYQTCIPATAGVANAGRYRLRANPVPHCAENGRHFLEAAAKPMAAGYPLLGFLISLTCSSGPSHRKISMRQDMRDVVV